MTDHDPSTDNDPSTDDAAESAFTDDHIERDTSAAFERLTQDAAQVDTMAALRALEERRRWARPGVLIGGAVAALLVIAGLIGVIASTGDDDRSEEVTATDDGTEPSDGDEPNDDAGARPDEDGESATDDQPADNGIGAQLEGTSWILAEGVGPDGPIEVIEDWPVTMTLADGWAEGRAACNRYSIDATVDDDGRWVVAGQGGGGGEELCELPEVMATEAAFGSALGLVTEVEADLVAGELVLLGDQVVLRFVALPLAPTEDVVEITWVLESLTEGDTTTEPAGEPALLRFAADGTLSGSTGCRDLRGEYVIRGAELFRTSGSARGRCTPSLSTQDSLIGSVLGETSIVELVDDQLTLRARGGRSLSYGRADGAENESLEQLIIGTWQLTSGTGPDGAIPTLDEARLTLDFDGTQMGGFGGCNGFGGDYELDGTTLIPGEIAISTEGCGDPVGALENAFVGAVVNADRVQVENDELVLSGPDIELRFDRAPAVPIDDIVGEVWVLETLTTGDETTAAAGADATLELSDTGVIGATTGCRRLEGTYIVRWAEVLIASSSMRGACRAALRDQDNHVTGVLGDGFTATIDGDRLVLSSRRGGIGLAYVRPTAPAQPVTDLEVTLRSDGLEIANSADGSTQRILFGAGREETLGTLEPLLGDWAYLSSTDECAGGPDSAYSFLGPSLILGFVEGTFTTWTVNRYSPLRTASGLGGGTTQSELEAAHPINPDLIPQTGGLQRFEITEAGATLDGILDGDGPDAPVAFLAAGASCLFPQQ